MDRMLAMGRGLNFMFWLGFQEVSGIWARLGEKTQSLFGNANLTIAMRQQDANRTRQWIEDTAGKTYVTQATSYQGGGTGEYAETRSAEVREVAGVDWRDLQSLIEGEAIILFGGRRIYAKLFHAEIDTRGPMRLNRPVALAPPDVESLKAASEHVGAVLKALQGGLGTGKTKRSATLAAMLGAFQHAAAAGHASLEAVIDRGEPSRLLIEISLRPASLARPVPPYDPGEVQRAIREGFREVLAQVELERLARMNSPKSWAGRWFGRAFAFMVCAAIGSVSTLLLSASHTAPQYAVGSLATPPAEQASPSIEVLAPRFAIKRRACDVERRADRAGDGPGYVRTARTVGPSGGGRGHDAAGDRRAAGTVRTLGRPTPARHPPDHDPSVGGGNERILGRCSRRGRHGDVRRAGARQFRGAGFAPLRRPRHEPARDAAVAPAADRGHPRLELSLAGRPPPAHGGRLDLSRERSQRPGALDLLRGRPPARDRARHHRGGQDNGAVVVPGERADPRLRVRAGGRQGGQQALRRGAGARPPLRPRGRRALPELHGRVGRQGLEHLQPLRGRQRRRDWRNAVEPARGIGAGRQQPGVPRSRRRARRHLGARPRLDARP